MTTRRLLVIGIGPGDPDQLTLGAVAAMGEVDVFVMIDKGDGSNDLTAQRKSLVSRFATKDPLRVIEVRDTRRPTDVPYVDAVASWHAERVAALEDALLTQVTDGQCAGILVWGDPSLYDSTLRIIDSINAGGRLTIDHEVIPGISSVALLAARHRITINRIGEPVQITTGRRLGNGLPPGVDDVVVMLDANNSFTTLVGQPYEIFWGAYLGSEHELLVSGLLADVAGEIVRVRADARARHGWMFDVYLLRRLPSA